MGCAVDIDGFDTYNNYKNVLKQLDNTSSPGYPYMMENVTIGEWLGFNGLTYDSVKVERLWHDVMDLLLDLDFSRVIWRCFIKQEPHKNHKMISKRYRLIMCPPLNVQVMWQMLFSKQNAIEIDKAYLLPSQQGLSLPFGRWQLFYDQWKSQGVTNGTDAVAWDWTLPGWMIRMDLDFRIRMVRGGDTVKWENAALKLYQDAFRDCKVIFSSGRIFQQLNWGIMKSGCVNTISSNSHCGLIYHLIYCLEKNVPCMPLPKCVGDDQLQHALHLEDIQVYEKYGKIIKSISSTIEFVGHEFHDTGPRPMYMLKHVYNLLHQKEDLIPEVLNSYLRLYANYKEGFDFWMEVALRLNLGGSIASERYYKRWYNNPDAENAFIAHK